MATASSAPVFAAAERVVKRPVPAQPTKKPRTPIARGFTGATDEKRPHAMCDPSVVAGGRESPLRQRTFYAGNAVLASKNADFAGFFWPSTQAPWSLSTEPGAESETAKGRFNVGVRSRGDALRGAMPVATTPGPLTCRRTGLAASGTRGGGLDHYAERVVRGGVVFRGGGHLGPLLINAVGGLGRWGAGDPPWPQSKKRTG